MQNKLILHYFGEKRMSIVEFVPIALPKNKQKTHRCISNRYFITIRKFKFERHTKGKQL
jgi:hypothetical protein